MEIGHTIAQLRTEKKISQKKLALDLNVSAGLVGLWETNKRFPSLEHFISLVDYFTVSADLLLEHERKLKPGQYASIANEVAPEIKKIIETFSQLNEDNQDILLGKAKELLKEQRIEEKRSSTPMAKAT